MHVSRNSGKNTLQTDNHTNTSSLNFYKPDALPDAKLTVSVHAGSTAYNTQQILQTQYSILDEHYVIVLQQYGGYCQYSHF